MASRSSRGERVGVVFVLVVVVLCVDVSTLVAAQPLVSSQAKTLLWVRRLLGFPPALDALAGRLTRARCRPRRRSPWRARAGRSPSSPCSAAARRRRAAGQLSADALFTTLTRLPALSRLTLASLGVWGELPGAKLHRLQALRVLNLTGNCLYGAVPEHLSRMYSLQSLVLSRNRLNGTVPKLSGLAFLDELDLGHNRLGPAFPEVGNAVVRLVLADNNFTGKIPAEVSSLGQLQFLDVSGNRLQGWIPSSIFALPALRHIDLSRNQLAGQLPASTACADALAFVDVSDNLLAGARPACMRGNSSARTVLDAGNCFRDARSQRPSTYCNPGALVPCCRRRRGPAASRGRAGRAARWGWPLASSAASWPARR